MSGEVNQHDALLRLGGSTAETIARVLESFAPGEVQHGEVTVLTERETPFGTIEPGTIAAGVSYVDGATGATVFLAPPASARALATRMGAQAPEEADAPITELELSAVSEATNQMMAAASGTVGVLLGQEIEISPPNARSISNAAEAEELFGAAPYATTTTFTVAGASYRLVQLVPSAFVIRIGQALSDLDGQDRSGSRSATREEDGCDDVQETLTAIDMRVWAELGRTQLPLAEALALPLGALVELDCATDAPINLYVNGLQFAHGRLLVDDLGRWAIEIDEIDHPRGAVPVTAP